MSNINNYKYDWIWNKKKSSSSMLAKKQPLRIYENIIIFGGKIYNPQMEQGKPRVDKENYMKNGDAFNGGGVVRKHSNPEGLYYPKNILEISNADQRGKIHPTQKPLALMEYLIKTYIHEGETVLDFTMGSGTTGVACQNLNRDFIGIEKDEKYYDIAKERIENTQDSLF